MSSKSSSSEGTTKRRKFNFSHKCELCFEGYISPIQPPSPATSTATSPTQSPVVPVVPVVPPPLVLPLPLPPSRVATEHWKCTHCEYSLPADIFRMKNKIISRRIDSRKDDWEALWNLIYDYDYILHPYHLYLYRILGYIVTLGWERIQNSKIDDVPYKFTLSMLTIAERVLEILKYIYPDTPNTIDIGRVLYLKQMLMGFKFIRDIECYRNLVHLYSYAEYMDIPGRINELKTIQVECHDILKTEPVGTKLGEMAAKLHSVLLAQDYVVAMLLPDRHYESRTILEFTRIYSRFCSGEYECNYTNQFDFGMCSIITGKATC